MAKKVVATMQTGAGKTYTKVIRMIKSSKTGAYSFKEDFIPNAEVKNYFAKKD